MKAIKEWILDKWYDFQDWFYYKFQHKDYDKIYSNAMLNCYRELYKKATPSADFDELMKNAPINKQGQKVIDFMAYYLPQDEMDKIIQKHIKKGKLGEWQVRSFSPSIYLGCSPTSVKRKA